MSGWARWDAHDAWDRPRRWQPYDIGAPTLPEEREPALTGNDEFGFALDVFGRFPRDVRYYLDVAYEYIGLNKQQTPTQQTMAQGDRGQAGTVPELVFFGLLLDNGGGADPLYLSRRAESVWYWWIQVRRGPAPAHQARECGLY
jgi:hypothetical protein